MSRSAHIETLRTNDRGITPNQPYAIDIFRPQDAPGVSRLYYHIYADAHPMDYVYSPEAVAKALTSDDHRAAVARTPSGELVGLMGAWRGAPNPGLWELGQLMVHTIYQGGHMAMQLYAYMVRTLCPSLNAEGVYGEAVCNHIASQTMSLYFEMKETGLELDVMPLPADQDGVPRRDSLLLMFRLLQDRPQRVHLPQHMRGFVAETYERLGAERLIESGSSELPERESACSVSRVPAAGLARLEVRTAGADLDARLDEIEQLAGPAGITHARLDLADSAAPAAIRLMEKRGYLIAGVQPLWFGSDAFLFQKLPGHPDLSGVKLFSKRAKALAAAILGTKS